MAISLQPPSNLTSIRGVRIATAAAGIKYQNRDDVVLLELCEGSSVAVIFTKNQFCAAPVTLAKKHLNQSKPRYLLINSGNANAGLGQQGIEDAMQCCNAIATEADCNVSEILPFSTGVIGESLPVDKINHVSPDLLSNLKEDTWLQAANAIMTTDTVAKGCSQQIELAGKKISITGVAKGSGMIRPDMATMLSYVATDLAIDNAELQQLLKHAADQSFHCITVDGDTSTNDACALIATARSGVKFSQLSDGEKEQFATALNEIFLHLAQCIIRDGEGVTKFIAIKVEQAKNESMARDIAFSVAHSPLVKTAAFASDPNWGRILAAAGRGSEQNVDQEKLSLYINSLKVIENGEIADHYDETLGQQEMLKDELQFSLQLGLGSSEITVWTTDLSYEYVKINAEYRT